MKAVAVGRKGRDFLLRTGIPVIAEFTGLGDYPSFDDIAADSPHRSWMSTSSGGVDRVYLVFPLFVNTMVQRPESAPAAAHRGAAAASRTVSLQYIYEPSPAEVFQDLLPRFVERQVYEAILEKSASEQSARMVAMRSATETANDMVEDLTLTYNKVRQESITKELLDIVGGAEALRSAE